MVNAGWPTGICNCCLNKVQTSWMLDVRPTDDKEDIICIFCYMLIKRLGDLRW